MKPEVMSNGTGSEPDASGRTADGSGGSDTEREPGSGGGTAGGSGSAPDGGSGNVSDGNGPDAGTGDGNSGPAQSDKPSGTPSGSAVEQPSSGGTGGNRKRRTRGTAGVRSGSGTGSEPGATGGVKDEEQSPITVQAPIVAKFQTETDKPRRRNTGSAVTKITVEEMEQLTASGFHVYSMTRPESLRGCWQYTPDQCTAIAEPAARMVNRLADMNPKAFKIMRGALDPIALVTAAYAMISASQKAERDAFASFLNANPEAREQYERHRAAKQSEQAKRKETLNPPSDGPSSNGTGADGTGHFAVSDAPLAVQTRADD